MKKRDKRIDTLRGGVILLVVLGHILGMVGTEDDVVNDWVWKFIATFWMPLFIFITGWLTNKKRIDAFFSGINSLLKPLLLFQMISLFFMWLTGRTLTIRSLIIPHFALWFLLSLVYWRFIIQFIPLKLLEKKYVLIGVAIILSVCCGLMPMGKILSVQRTFHFFVFFIFGYYIGHGHLKAQLWNNRISYIIIASIILLICLGMYPSNSRDLLNGSIHYQIRDLPSKAFLLLCSFSLSLSVFYVAKTNCFFEYFGKNSMTYYLYHGLLVEFVLLPIVQKYNLPTSFPYICLYFFIIILIVFYISKINLFVWLTKPTTPIFFKRF